MRILCGMCSKNLKKLRVCRKCGKPLCFSCDVKGCCPTCQASMMPDRLSYDYFKDKYEVMKDGSQVI